MPFANILKKLIKSRAFLLKLFLTIVVFVCIPLLALQIFVIGQSTEEFKETYEEHLFATLQSSFAILDEQGNFLIKGSDFTENISSEALPFIVSAGSGVLTAGTEDQLQIYKYIDPQSGVAFLLCTDKDKSPEYLTDFTQTVRTTVLVMLVIVSIFLAVTICINYLSIHRLPKKHTATEVNHELHSEIALPDESIRQVCGEMADTEQTSDLQLQQRLIQFVDTNFTRSELSLTAAADHIGASIYAVSRLFKEVTGKGFKDYVTEKRLEHGHMLLSTTSKSIAEISAESGFENSNYFSTVFKQKYGMPPTKYRNLQKDKQSI